MGITIARSIASPCKCCCCAFDGPLHPDAGKTLGIGKPITLPGLSGAAGPSGVGGAGGDATESGSGFEDKKPAGMGGPPTPFQTPSTPPEEMDNWTGIRVPKDDLELFQAHLRDKYRVKNWYYAITPFKDQPYWYLFEGGPPPDEWAYSLEREILWRMITSRRFFDFKTTGALDKYIEIRMSIVDVATTIGNVAKSNSPLDFVADSDAWPKAKKADSDVLDWERLELKNKDGTPKMDGKDKQMTDIWDACGEDKIRLAKEGKVKILDEIFVGKHNMAVGCGWAMRLIILRGLELTSTSTFAKGLTSVSIAKLGLGLLAALTTSDKMEKRAAADRGGWDWVPGDGGWIENLNPPTAASMGGRPEGVEAVRRGDFLGENIIYLGGSFDYPLGWAVDKAHDFLYSSTTKSKFFGWPGGNKTMNDWYLEIQSHFPTGGDGNPANPDVHASRMTLKTDVEVK